MGKNAPVTYIAHYWLLVRLGKPLCKPGQFQSAFPCNMIPYTSSISFSCNYCSMSVLQPYTYSIAPILHHNYSGILEKVLNIWVDQQLTALIWLQWCWEVQQKLQLYLVISHALSSHTCHSYCIWTSAKMHYIAIIPSFQCSQASGFWNGHIGAWLNRAML